MSWALLEAAAAPAIDAVLEEDFTFQSAAPPAIDVDARRVLSGDPFAFRGIWAEPDAHRFPDARGHASSDARQFGAGLPRLDFPTSALASRPKQSDLVTRVATGVRYAISHVGGNGFTRTVLTLTAQQKVV